MQFFTRQPEAATWTHAELSFNEDTREEEMRVDIGPVGTFISLERAARLVEQINHELAQANYFGPPTPDPWFDNSEENLLHAD